MFRHTLFVIGMSLLLAKSTFCQAPSTAGSVNVSMCKNTKAGTNREGQIVKIRTGELIVLRNGLNDEAGYFTQQAEWDLYRSTDLEFISTTKIKRSNENGERIQWETLVSVGSVCRVIGTTIKPPIRIYHQPIYVTPGPNVDQPSLIHTWTTEVSSEPFQSMRDEKLLIIRSSPDSSRVLILRPLGITKEGRSIGLLVLDRDLNLIWSQELNIASRTSIFELLDAAVDNHGKAFVFTHSQFFNNKERVDQGSDMKSLIHHVSPKEISTYEVQLGRNTKVYAGKCSAMIPGQIVCAGLYDDQDLSSKGQFRFSQTTEQPSDAILFQQSYDSTALHTSDNGVSRSNEKNSLLRKFSRRAQLVDFLVDTTGSYMITEEFSIQSALYGSTSGSLVYEHGAVLIQRVDPNGKEVWSHLIQRDRSSTDESAGRIVSMVRNNHLVLSLNLSKYEAFHLNGKQYICPGSSRVPALIQIAPTGNLKLEGLTCDEVIDHISGSEIVDIGNGTYITLATAKANGGRNVPAKLRFSE